MAKTIRKELAAKKSMMDTAASMIIERPIR